MYFVKSSIEEHVNEQLYCSNTDLLFVCFCFTFQTDKAQTTNENFMRARHLSLCDRPSGVLFFIVLPGGSLLSWDETTHLQVEEHNMPG